MISRPIELNSVLVWKHVKEADVPTWVTLDNETVVCTAALISLGQHAEVYAQQSSDPWVRLLATISTKPIGFFRSSWIKGNLDLHPEYVQTRILRLKKPNCMLNVIG